MSGVEFLKHGQGIGIVLRGKYRGELRVQSGIVRCLLERRPDKLFRFGIVLVFDENVGKARVGGDGFGIAGEHPTVGRLGCVVLA